MNIYIYLFIYTVMQVLKYRGSLQRIVVYIYVSHGCTTVKKIL